MKRPVTPFSPSAANQESAGALPPGVVVAAVCGLAAAWVAAGSIGLAGHALRHALMWVLLTASVAAAWPKGRTPTGILIPPHAGGLLLALVAAIAMTASPLQAVNVLAVAVALAGLAAGRFQRGERKALLVSAQAVAVFALARILITSIGGAWVIADAAGGWLGSVGGAIAGRKLAVGPSFAGLDYLVLMAALLVLWLAATPRPRLGRGLAGAVAILVGHLAYLIILSFAQELASIIPAGSAAPTPMSPFDRPWLFWVAVKTLLPWNLPLLACLIQIIVACGVLRWAPPPAATGAETQASSGIGLASAAAVAVVVLAVATSLYGRPEGLAGKKIVANEKGFLNWLRPTQGEYGRLSIGMYGMLADTLESFGGKLVRTTDFSDADLKDASVVILIFPNKPWEKGQLERIWKFVERGGSLLVMGEHTIREEGGDSRFNDALAPTRMRVQFDSAQWAVGGWLGCYETMAHPITLGHRDERNDLGVVIGASVDARWPARPVILGRWGWSDWGDEGSPRAMMGNDRVDPGERLGDVTLAAEERLGRGKVIVFGDTSSLTNGINIGSYRSTAALLSYLSGPESAPALWREALALLAAAAAAVLLVFRAPPWRVAAAGVAAGIALAVCTAVTHSANTFFPDGNCRQPNHLAYVDSSHLEAYSPESLRDDGIMGLEYTLMRNGFLTLSLSDFHAEALDRAALLVSIAPSRPFSASEREAVKRFVENGGVFIVTSGYDQSEAVAPLLKEFGLRVGSPTGPGVEPRPLGHFKSPYVNIQGRMHYVRFHAAWPVAADDSAPGPRGGKLEPAQVLAYGGGDVPVILMRPWGKGKVVLVGDTCFAMNKNLEHVDGSPFEGMRENADFWRWFLGHAAGRPAWMPPGPEAPPAAPPAKAAPAPARKPAAPAPARKAAVPAAKPASPAPAAAQPAEAQP